MTIKRLEDLKNGSIVELREHRFMIVINPNNDYTGILRDADGYFNFEEFDNDLYFKGFDANNDIIRIYEVINPRGYECIWHDDVKAFIDYWPDWFNLIWRNTDFSKDKEEKYQLPSQEEQIKPQSWEVNFVKLKDILTHLNEKTAIINRKTEEFDDETMDIEKEIQEAFKFDFYNNRGQNC